MSACPAVHPLLELSAVQLSEKDLDKPVLVEGFNGAGPTPVRDIIRALKETYCHGIGVEYMHLQDPSERRWLQDRMEPNRNRPDLDTPTRLQILEKLYQANLFEQFLHKKYLGQTRFSLEGAESVIPMMNLLLEQAAGQGVREIILGMAHRGRLNVQAHILEKPYEDIFGEFESCYDPDELVGAGDVKYHNGYLADIETRNGDPLRAFGVHPLREGRDDDRCYPGRAQLFQVGRAQLPPHDVITGADSAVDPYVTGQPHLAPCIPQRRHDSSARIVRPIDTHERNRYVLCHNVFTVESGTFAIWCTC